MRFLPTFLVVPVLLLTLIAYSQTARAEHEGKVQILLLGDSLTEGSVPRAIEPKAQHLEDVIRILLAAEGDLPPVNVINVALSGEYIHRLLDTQRYDKVAAKLPGLDYVLIRYGANDLHRREDFDTNFPKDIRELVGRLKADHPAANIILVTNMPLTVTDEGPGSNSQKINDHIRKVAEEDKLTLMDLHPRYLAELKKGPNMLNYRRFPLAKIPARLQPLAEPFVMPGKEPQVIVLDNRLDAHFGELPGWFGDRHPNLAGYHVIGDETAKFLAPLIRKKK